MIKKYYVCDYGAKSDGTLCTQSIQKAIDTCFLSGGGEVIIPKGIFLTGGLRLRSNVTLHLMENAVLLGSIDPNDYCDYINDAIEPFSQQDIDTKVSSALPQATSSSIFPYSRWNNAIIRAINAKNIAIIGEEGAEINGQNCFDADGEEKYRGPHAINMWFCENIILKGYTIKDSANWAHAIQNSKKITAEGITVLGGHDGFDIRTCDDISIENCKFLTGDDCIAGFDNINVTVRNCYFESSCSIFRFGGTDILIENCRGVAPASYGFRGNLTEQEKQNRIQTHAKCRHNCLNVFLYYCDYRAAVRKTPGNIFIRNSTFDSPDCVFNLPFGSVWSCNRSLDNITFENCVFNDICRPIHLKCPQSEPLNYLQLKNCTITVRKGFEQISLIEGENVKEIKCENIVLENFENPKIVCMPKPEIFGI